VSAPSVLLQVLKGSRWKLIHQGLQPSIAPARWGAAATTDQREATLDHIYPVTEVYGSSSESIDDAIRNAVSVANQSIRNLEWFEVTEIRGHVASDGSVGHFQVGVKLGFRFERRPSS
jgi:dodecin